jgi:hypothetical protein
MISGMGWHELYRVGNVPKIWSGTAKEWMIATETDQRLSENDKQFSEMWWLMIKFPLAID